MFNYFFFSILFLSASLAASETINPPAMIDVAPGKAIIGAVADGSNEQPQKIVTLKGFSIGTYLVTNSQYATWLNAASRKEAIKYISEADRQGQVIDTEGHLIFKTSNADKFSQITLDGDTFIPVKGKESYPVINVAWDGAVAYCKDNHCRLPTEAEWEKAAGMAKETPEEPLRKYLYGFGSDTIDRTFANYKEKTTPLERFHVLTTPVGFYNGVNDLPADENNREQQRTHLAKSPYGAFDMSGNVWEWTADWFDPAYTTNMSDADPQGPSQGSLKVVKGGCYDSLADGVRVSERMGLSLNYTDAYTGFRVGKDL